MRYIADSAGYVKEVSFGAIITCEGSECVEYTGAAPEGYSSLEDWFNTCGGELWRWMIVDGNLTLDPSAEPPADPGVSDSGIIYVESVEESWVEKKLKLKSGSRYYIQGFQTSDGTFTKKISCKIETEGAFDANKLSMIYDDKFYELHCSISNNEAEGCLCDMIVPDEDIFNPYELYYDGKKFKCNKFRIDRVLKGESYMTFEWN